MREELRHIVIRRAPLAYATFFVASLLVSVFLLTLHMAFWLSVLIGMVIAVSGTELLFRITLFLFYGSKYIYKIKPYIIVDDPLCGYRLRKNGDVSKIQKYLYEKYAFNPISGNRVELTTGPNGFRGEPHLEFKSNKTYRIYCSGGSTTAGYGVDDNETWPFQLEKIMNSKNSGRDYQVINGGVYGWNSTQELTRIKAVVEKFDIDALILHQGWNEEFAYSTMNAGGKWSRDTKGDYYSRYYFFSESIRWVNPFLSIVLSLKCLRRDRLLKKRLSFSNPSRWSNLKHYDYMNAWLDNLISVVGICKSRSIDLWLIKAPSIVSIEDSVTSRKLITENSRMSLLHAEYQSIAKARIDSALSGVSDYLAVIDAGSDFSGIPVEDKPKYFIDEMHLTRLGELMLAEIISRKLNDPVHKKSVSGINLEGLKGKCRTLAKNSPELDKRIDETWAYLCASAHKETYKISVPEDHYTTH